MVIISGVPILRIFTVFGIINEQAALIMYGVLFVLLSIHLAAVSHNFIDNRGSEF